MEPNQLKSVISDGLLSFPLTDFTASGDFNPQSYAARLEWLKPYGASALFAAGGTGELFSLEPVEHGRIIRTAVDVCRDETPILAGVGFSTRIAVQMAQEAERQGAAGLLVLPHYLTEAAQDGIAAHVSAICAAVKIGVIVYNRANSRLNADSLARLADKHPNLIGYKDGLGDIEMMVTIRRKMGDRLAYLGGLPTAEVFASAYRALGVPVYSSAVFNFIPKTAMDFYKALSGGDMNTVNRLLDTFFLPLIELRNKKAGYAVSMVKAGAAIVGHPAGPVRTPLTDLNDDEIKTLEKLISAVGAQ